ncbi:FkbM family methyltransferase [Engelhardtia mirabilis]|uniref:Methyltransferase FkbM domain-containing protein n=1 Tax=Engelhardtia mirabilis TaxID=2528011 RepID=A0A518BFM0_9BACT|nr:hypothetical protein Pla133_08460 [Planctomycetes bacterium Pla133]QDV00106.1 hypothetical protein Pla86_08450 [Planctomycetes bacterium Pla86]
MKPSTEFPSTPSAADFRQRLVGGLIDGAFQTAVHNTDPLRFPAGPFKRLRRELRQRWRAGLGRLGLARRGKVGESQYLQYVLANLDGFERTFTRLGDGASRETMLAVLRFRALGAKHVKLPANTPGYWKTVESVDREHLVERDTGSAGDLLGGLNRYRVDGSGRAHGDGGAIEADLHPLNVLNTFLFEHYAYRVGTKQICARRGDVVVDGGGCWGDTALYFADRVGPTGRVFVFEFEPSNLEVLRANLERNPTLAERVTVVERALWDESDLELSFGAGDGAATRVSAGEGASSGATVLTLTIDDLVEREGLAGVDWIKLDVEGAELAALRGARQTLARSQPRLAISAYHKPEDLVTLPDFVAQVMPDHEQFLDHITIHAEETVLFARPRVEHSREI